MAQMPGGVPVGTLAVGNAGAKNAALLAARMIALKDESVRARLKTFIEKQTQKVMDAGVEVSLEEIGLLGFLSKQIRSPTKRLPAEHRRSGYVSQLHPGGGVSFGGGDVTIPASVILPSLASRGGSLPT